MGQDNGFRWDAYSQRARVSSQARKQKTRPAIIKSISNAGKPIEITHIGVRKVEGIVPFLFHFPHVKPGYADLYFLAPESLVSPWLTTHDRSFYEAGSVELRGLLARREVYALAHPVFAVHGERLIQRGEHIYVRPLEGKDRSLGMFEDLIALGPTRGF